MLKRFRQRSEASEWLDRPPIPREELELNLLELERINRLLGGHRATLKGIEELLPRGTQSCSVIDVGCGGGDTLAAIDRFAAEKGMEIGLTGVDPLPEALDLAKKHWKGNSGPKWIESSFEALNGGGLHDITTASLFCHHLYGEDLRGLLQKLFQLSRIGVVINDLHRHPLAYYGIRGLSSLLSRSSYLRHDAPLSVLKAFKRKEWKAILADAGIDEYRIHWVWAFRHCIVIPKAQKDG